MATKLPYDKLRVRLRREPRSGETDMLWGKPLSRTKWTVFQREEFRDGKWMGLAWEVVRREEMLRIEGKIGGRWEAVSTWLIEERRRKASGVPSADSLTRKARTIEEIREGLALATGRKPGRGELAYHLLDHVGMTGEETLRMMQRLDWEVAPEDLPGQRRNGQDRRRQGLPCRFCVRERK